MYLTYKRRNIHNSLKEVKNYIINSIMINTDEPVESRCLDCIEEVVVAEFFPSGDELAEILQFKFSSVLLSLLVKKRFYRGNRR